jgi:REP element-mobilizing transposase RayT
VGSGLLVFSMPHGLQRIAGFGDLHFITFTCYQHRKFLASARSRNVTVQILGEVRARFPFALVGYVVMPDHVHLLIKISLVPRDDGEGEFNTEDTEVRGTEGTEKK